MGAMSVSSHVWMNVIDTGYFIKNETSYQGNEKVVGWANWLCYPEKNASHGHWHIQVLCGICWRLPMHERSHCLIQLGDQMALLYLDLILEYNTSKMAWDVLNTPPMITMTMRVNMNHGITSRLWYVPWMPRLSLGFLFGSFINAVPHWFSAFGFNKPIPWLSWSPHCRFTMLMSFMHHDCFNGWDID